MGVIQLNPHVVLKQTNKQKTPKITQNSSMCHMFYFTRVYFKMQKQEHFELFRMECKAIQKVSVNFQHSLKQYITNSQFNQQHVKLLLHWQSVRTFSIIQKKVGFFSGACFSIQEPKRLMMSFHMCCITKNTYRNTVN